MIKSFAILLLLVSFNSFSQTTYPIASFGNVGYSLKLTTVTSGLSGVDFTLTGVNYSWDYSTLGRTSNAPETILNPDNTGYKIPFITLCTYNTNNPFSCNTKWNDLTDVAFLELDSLATPILTIYDVTALMSKKNNVLVTNIQGAKVADSSNNVVPITTEFIDKDTVYAFPLNYLNTHSSNGKWEVDLTPVGRDIALKVSYTRTYTVEGWGELITPFKTHTDVLKVRTVINEIDSLRYQTFNFGVPRKTVKYTWFDAAYGMPVMEATGQIDPLNNETITQVTYLDSTTIAGIYEIQKAKVVLYPNPANQILTVKLVDNIKADNIKIFSIAGILLKEINTINAHNLIDISFLTQGSYLVQVSNKNTVIYNTKLIKN